MHYVANEEALVVLIKVMKYCLMYRPNCRLHSHIIIELDIIIYKCKDRVVNDIQ
jgi:hypothetical protein